MNAMGQSRAEKRWKRLQRREFLGLAAGAGLAGLAGMRRPRLLRAGYFESRLWGGPVYLNVELPGGLDQSALVDPRNDPTINHYPGPAGFAGNIAYAPLGENAPFFTRYRDHCLALNGIDVASLSHENARRLQATGSTGGSYPCFASLYSAAVGAGLPIPWVGRGGPLFTGGLATFSRNLDGSAEPNFQEPGDASNKWVRDGDLAIMQRHRLERLAALGRREHMPHEQRLLEQHRSARENAVLLQALRDVLPPAFDDTGPGIADAHQILVAFQAGVTVAGSLSLEEWDKHAAYDAQYGTLIRDLNRLLDYVWTKAEALGLAGRLVVHVSSDVGRTPFYNPNAGKDHHPLSSALFMARLPYWANRVVGMSGPRHEHLRIDPRTLQENPHGIQLRPAHVQRALRKLLGIDGHPLARSYEFGEPALELIDTSASSPVFP
jgi:hypothetical protein